MEDLTKFANDLATETIDASIRFLKDYSAIPICIVLGSDLEDLPIARKDEYKKLPIYLVATPGHGSLIRVLTANEVNAWEVEL
jgi:hypothetical protein